MPVRADLIHSRVPGGIITEGMLPSLLLCKGKNIFIEPGDEAHPKELPLLRMLPTIRVRVREKSRTALVDGAPRRFRRRSLNLHYQSHPIGECAAVYVFLNRARKTISGYVPPLVFGQSSRLIRRGEQRLTSFGWALQG